MATTETLSVTVDDGLTYTVDVRGVTLYTDQVLSSPVTFPLSVNATTTWYATTPTRVGHRDNIEVVVTAPSGAIVPVSTFNALPATVSLTEGVVDFAAPVSTAYATVLAMGAPSGDTTGATDGATYRALMAKAVAASGKSQIVFSAGDYYIACTQRTTNDTTTFSAHDGHMMRVSASNVTIRGAGIGATTIHRLGYGGGAATTYQTVNGAVWRGGGIFIDGGVSNVTLTDFTLDGGAGYTGNATFPANVSTGDGWDVTDKGVWLENNTAISNVFLRNVEIKSFRGELVYASGTSTGLVSCTDSIIHDTNGDCWSVSGKVLLKYSELYKTAANGIDDSYINAPASYVWNYVHDCDQTGIHVYYASALSEPLGPALIQKNTVQNCKQHGIYTQSPHNMRVEDNTIIDCTYGTGNFAGIWVDTANSLPVRDVTVRRNLVLADTQNVPNQAYLFNDGASAGVHHLFVEDNVAMLTAAGAAAGKTLNLGYAPNSVGTDGAWRNNRSIGATYEYTDQDTTTETLLTTTTMTTVAKRRPERSGRFLVCFYPRVVTAATVVTVQIKYTDASGSAQWKTGSLGSQAVGGVIVAPYFINASGPTESDYIEAQAQAGTANQVYVTAQIIEL